MMRKSQSKRSVLYAVILSLMICSVSSCVSAASYSGLTSGLRGGFGVKAAIDNHQLSWGSRDIHWYLTIEGSFVLFGTSSGFVPAMGMGFVHSSLLPPAIGFGPVTVTLTIYSAGNIAEVHQHSGFMIGPFVILI